MKMNRIELRRLIESVINEDDPFDELEAETSGKKSKNSGKFGGAFDDLDDEADKLEKRRQGKRSADDKPTPPKDLEPIQISKSEEVEIDRSMIKPPRDPQNQKEAEEQLKACIAAIEASDDPTFDQMEIIEKYKVNDRVGVDPKGKQKDYKYLEVGTKAFEIHDRGLYQAYVSAGDKEVKNPNLKESFGLSRGSLYRRRYGRR